MSALGLLLWAATAQPLDLPSSQQRPEVAVEQLRACGFEHVAIRDDRDLQEDVLTVSGATDTSEGQLRCAAQVSLSSIIYVEFPEALNAKYAPLYSRMEQDEGRRHARAWLQRRGLLARLPMYTKGKVDDLAFARQLEALCGPKAKGIFARDRGIVTMRMGTLEKPTMDDQTLFCLMNVASASGFPVGFIGNEYYRDNKKPGQ